jgi:hypothetical protein
MKKSLMLAVTAVVALSFGAPALADSTPPVMVVTPQSNSTTSCYANWGYYSDELYDEWTRFEDKQPGWTDQELVSGPWLARHVELKVRFDVPAGALVLPACTVPVFWKNITDGTKSDCFDMPVAYSINPDGKEHYWTAFSVYRADYAVIEWQIGMCEDLVNPAFSYAYFVDGFVGSP